MYNPLSSDGIHLLSYMSCSKFLTCIFPGQTNLKTMQFILESLLFYLQWRSGWRYCTFYTKTKYVEIITKSDCAQDFSPDQVELLGVRASSLPNPLQKRGEELIYALLVKFTRLMVLTPTTLTCSSCRFYWQS